MVRAVTDRLRIRLSLLCDSFGPAARPREFSGGGDDRQRSIPLPFPIPANRYTLPKQPNMPPRRKFSCRYSITGTRSFSAGNSAENLSVCVLTADPSLFFATDLAG